MSERLDNDEAAGIIIGMLSAANDNDLPTARNTMASLSYEDLRKVATIMLGMLFGNTVQLARERGMTLDQWLDQARQALLERRLS